MTIVMGIIALGILIFVHELGHFVVAKLCGVGVLEFAIGFGRRLVQRQVGGTTYALRAIPLGGFVKMAGDDPFAMDGNGGQSAEATLTQQEQKDFADNPLLKDESKWFLKKSYWKKSAIVLAGPMANILFAYVLAVSEITLYGVSDPSDAPVIGEVYPGFPAEKAGLKRLDRVLTLDGAPVHTFSEIAKKMRKTQEDALASPQAAVVPHIFEIERKDETKAPHRLTITVTPTLDTQDVTALDEGPKQRRAMIGITSYADRQQVTIPQAFLYGAFSVYNVSYLTVRSLVLLVRREISSKNVSGPIFMVQEAGKSAERGGAYLFSFMTFVSVALAIFNLLPVPILDGGHLLFFTLEAIKGGPLSMRAQVVAQNFGMVLLMGLMLFATWNDILRLVMG